MLTSRLMVCSEDAVRDAETNQLSLFKIVETIVSPSLPVVMPRLCACGFFERAPNDPARFTCRLDVRLGTIVLLAREITFDFGDLLRHRAVVHMTDLMLPAEGILQVSFTHGSAEVASYAIPVGRLTERAR